MPTDLKKYAHFEQWFYVESEEFNPAISLLVAELVFLPKYRGKPTDEAVVKTQSEKLVKALDVLEEHFKKTNHKILLGDTVSLADFSY